ncbi:MAG: hypothetical protein ABIG61_08375 [Planctomycetota bacterium]
MRRLNGKYWRGGVFSLAEAGATLVIGAMVTVALLMFYNNMEKQAFSINSHLDEYTLPVEILQRIAEDMDRVVTPGSDLKIRITNTYSSGFRTARLIITSEIVNNDSKPQTFEKIVWQSSYDITTNRLTLYRSHSGINVEDALLSKQEEEWKEMKLELFVPLCTGVSFFQVQALKNSQLLDDWTTDALPHGVVVTISFADPVETTMGLDIPTEKLISRTIAVDRTRKITFNFTKKKDETGKSQQVR